MVIDHADRLHEGIHRGAADEVEAGLLQGLGKRVGLGCPGGEIGEGFEVVHDGFAAGEAPKPFHGIAELQPGFGILADG